MHHQIYRVLMLLPLLTLCLNARISLAQAEAEWRPDTYQLHYAARYNGMDVTARRELTKTAEGYSITSKIKGLLGKMTEREEFHVDGQGHIIVDHFIADKSFFGLERRELLSVDHNAGVAAYTRKKKHRQIVLQPGLLGPVTYQLQLRRDLADGASSLAYQVMSRGKIRDYKFLVVGEELLDSPLGPINTLVVRRVRDDNERETLMWLAPDWQFTVVKIRQREGKENYEMTLQAGSVNGIKLFAPSL